jgi:hypothetical protein
MPGTCFLYGLRNSVHPFPMWSALPPQSTMSVSDSLAVFSHPSFCWVGLPQIKQGYDFKIDCLKRMSFIDALPHAATTCHTVCPTNLPLVPHLWGTARVSQVLAASLFTCHVPGHRQSLGNLTMTIPLYRLPLR